MTVDSLLSIQYLHFELCLSIVLLPRYLLVFTYCIILLAITFANHQVVSPILHNQRSMGSPVSGYASTLSHLSSRRYVLGRLVSRLSSTCSFDNQYRWVTPYMPSSSWSCGDFRVVLFLASNIWRESPTGFYFFVLFPIPPIPMYLSLSVASGENRRLGCPCTYGWGG